MGIPERKERERQTRRQQIMDAAKKVFCAKGFSGATMEDIASRAELSPATLYLYFRNKEELYASLNIQILHYLIERLGHLRGKKGLTEGKKVEGLKELLYEVFEFDPLILTNVFHLQSSDGLRNLSPELLAEIRDLSAKSIRGLAQIFEEGIREGVFVQRPAIALADVVWAVFSGLVLWEESKRMLDPRKDFLKPTLDLALEIICRGIGRP
jgi:AcrR family transcriptional regulator